MTDELARELLEASTVEPTHNPTHNPSKHEAFVPTLLFQPEPRRASRIYPTSPKVDFANRVALSGLPSSLKVALRKRVAAPKFLEPRRDQIS